MYVCVYIYICIFLRYRYFTLAKVKTICVKIYMLLNVIICYHILQMVAGHSKVSINLWVVVSANPLLRPLPKSTQNEKQSILAIRE